MLISRSSNSQQLALWRNVFLNSRVYTQPCSYVICRQDRSLAYPRIYAYGGTYPKYFCSSIRVYEKEKLKPSSKVEETVNSLKEEEKNKEVISASTEPKKLVVKRSLWVRIVDECKHYYHGFRLLYIDSKIAFGFMWRMLKGESLSRREQKQLVRTTADLFRLVPFSVFLIVPFMELLLPVFIKLFPNMLPSTFQTANEKEAKMKASLKIKLEMARFLQQTLDDMALKGKGRHSEKAKEFVEFFNKVRNSGEEASNVEIIRFSKLFEDEITLESLTRQQLQALCRLLEIQPIGTNNFLRFQLQLKLRSLAADDTMIQKEGLDSLTAAELQSACRARGMRAYGLPEDRLRQQLLQWLDLSLNQKVPPSLLLLSRTLYLPETVTTGDQLKATISSLPESIASPTKAAIGEKEGRIDNELRLKLVQEEQAKIKEEREEQKKIGLEKKKRDAEILADRAAIILDKAQTLELRKPEELSSDDLAVLEEALENVGVEKKKLLLEKEELSEIKKELHDYQEDIADLNKFISATGKSPRSLKESTGARRLFKRVNNIISNLDKVVGSLEKSKEQLKDELEGSVPIPSSVKGDLVSVNELINAIRKLQKIDDAVKLEQIAAVLAKLDDDQDGAIKVDDVMKVIELIGKEHIDLPDKQVSEIIDMLRKESVITRETSRVSGGQETAKIVTTVEAPMSSETFVDPQPIRYKEKSGVIIEAEITPQLKDELEMNLHEKLKHGQTVETKNLVVSLEEGEKGGSVKIEFETVGKPKVEDNEKLGNFIPPTKIDERTIENQKRV